MTWVPLGEPVDGVYERAWQLAPVDVVLTPGTG